MTIEQQLQKALHETTILREMISIFSDWSDFDKEWVCQNLDKQIEWLCMLEDSFHEKS